MSNGFTLAKQSEVFKTNYDKKSENFYNSANVLNGRIKKNYKFTGSEKSILTSLSFSGGVGSGRLPKSNAAAYKQAKINSHKVYATCEIEREAIHASADDKGAFVRATQETVKKTVESYMRNSSRILFGDGTGILGSGNASGSNVSGNGALLTPYVVTFPVSGWKESNWEEEDYVQMVVAGSPEGGDTETNLLRVLAVNTLLRQVSLVGTSTRLAALTGVGPLAATDNVVMQRSYNTDPTGLKSILDFTLAGSGSLYDVPFQRRWMATVSDQNSKGVTTDKMNNIMLDMERKTGMVPNLIMTSYKQFQNILALLEDHKTYFLGNKNLVPGKELNGLMSFKGVEFMSTRGPIGIFTERFCDDDKIWFLNSEHIEVNHRPGFGWFTEDKTVFLRLQDDDAYGARYGGYYENYIVPTTVGCLYDLAV